VARDDHGRAPGAGVVTWLSRNGYFFTIDRTTGENIVTSKVFPNTNWSFDRLRSSGPPEPIQNKSLSRGGTLVSPSSEGVANYPAQSFSPQTGLHYTNIVNGYGEFYWSGETFIGTFKNSLRATDPATGKVAWQHDYLEPYGIHARYPSVLTTAGGLLFTGDISGNFVAFEAKTGEILWHDELPEASVTGVPVTFTIGGKQYLAVPSCTKIVAYALRGVNKLRGEEPLPAVLHALCAPLAGALRRVAHSLRSFATLTARPPLGRPSSLRTFSSIAFMVAGLSFRNC
jgi:alcohol dehydrogenase (cytochrome c)